METTIELTPELERFAEACVASGRYGNLSEVVRSALNLMQDAEAQAQTFVASLDEAAAEGERDGFVSLTDATSRAYAAIEEVERGKR